MIPDTMHDNGGINFAVRPWTFFVMGHNKPCICNRDYLDDALRQGGVRLQYSYSYHTVRREQL